MGQLDLLFQVSIILLNDDFTKRPHHLSSFYTHLSALSPTYPRPHHLSSFHSCLSALSAPHPRPTVYHHFTPASPHLHHLTPPTPPSIIFLLLPLRTLIPPHTPASIIFLLPSFRTPTTSPRHTPTIYYVFTPASLHPRHVTLAPHPHHLSSFYSRLSALSPLILAPPHHLSFIIPAFLHSHSSPHPHHLSSLFTPACSHSHPSSSPHPPYIIFLHPLLSAPPPPTHPHHLSSFYSCLSAPSNLFLK